MTAFRSLLPAGGSTVGIDIGKRAIKVAQVRRTGKGVELQRWGIAPTPRGSVDGGVVSDPQAVAQALRGLLRTARIGTPHLVPTGHEPFVSPHPSNARLRE